MLMSMSQSTLSLMGLSKNECWQRLLQPFIISPSVAEALHARHSLSPRGNSESLMTLNMQAFGLWECLEKDPGPSLVQPGVELETLL